MPSPTSKEGTLSGSRTCDWYAFFKNRPYELIVKANIFLSKSQIAKLVKLNLRKLLTKELAQVPKIFISSMNPNFLNNLCL